MQRPRPARAEWLMAAAVSLLFVLAWFTWRHGAAGPVPVHVGLDGQPDRWTTRAGAARGIGLLGVLGLAALAALGVGARQAGASRAGFAAGQAVLVLVFLLVGVLLSGLAGALGPTGPNFPVLMLALVDCVGGALLGRVTQNRLVGLRTPWTRWSRLAWERSNRLTGRLLFLGGLAGVGLALGAPARVGMPVMAGWTALAVLLGVAESWRVWRGDAERVR